MTETLSISALTIALGPDDFEERRLIEQIVELHNKRVSTELKSLAFGKTSQKSQSSQDDGLLDLLKRLGYDPRSGKRPVRPRGRARNDALPTPLPRKETELKSCIGQTYTIKGYLKYPCKASEGYDLVVYEDAEGELRARNITHLFTGTLASGLPFVTWAEDPRGYKPEEEVPLSKRRSLSKRDLEADRRSNDQDYIQDQEARKSGRRY